MMWMRVWSSWAKSGNISVNMEAISPATLNEMKDFLISKFVIDTYDRVVQFRE